jgi:hypothetical protein
LDGFLVVERSLTPSYLLARKHPTFRRVSLVRIRCTSKTLWVAIGIPPVPTLRRMAIEEGFLKESFFAALI